MNSKQIMIGAMLLNVREKFECVQNKYNFLATVSADALFICQPKDVSQTNNQTICKNKLALW
jgi:hypothetical protein